MTQAAARKCSSRDFLMGGDTAMHKHILIPTDGSELSNEAIQYGTDLAKAANAKVTGVTVSGPFHVVALEPHLVTDTPESYRERINAVAVKRLARVQDAAAAAGVPCEVVHIEHEHPYQAIIDVAKTRGCDLIVMASHGRRGISAIVLGSETLKVLTHSTTPVLVCRTARSALLPRFAAS
jgi:nucleotide-binding universal stress UspA family protein